MANDIKKMNTTGGSGRRKLLSFNYMVSLPHMGRGRSRRRVMEFVNLIKIWKMTWNSNNSLIDIWYIRRPC